MYRALLGPILGLLSLPSCVGDHDVLAKQGEGGVPGAGGSGAGGKRPLPAAGGAPSSGGAGGEAGMGTGGDPPGPRVLTMLNGVTDTPTAFFCFATVRNGVESPLEGTPVPPDGLAYGAHFVPDLPGVTLPEDGFRPYVVAAAPDAVAGFDCAAVVAGGRGTAADAPVDRTTAVDANSEASAPADAASDASTSGDARSDGSTDAKPAEASRTDSGDADADSGAGVPSIPPIRVAALPIVPGGTFARSRSYLLALGGCLGGPGVTDPSERSVCGEFYEPLRPTLTPVLVALSRKTDPARVGVQFLVASPPVPEAKLTFGLASADPIDVVGNVSFGALRPESPNTKSSAQDIRALAADSKIRVYVSGSTEPNYEEPWSGALGVAGVSVIENGLDYTLVLVGPYPGFDKRSWWNDPLVAIVPN